MFFSSLSFPLNESQEVPSLLEHDASTAHAAERVLEARMLRESREFALMRAKAAVAELKNSRMSPAAVEAAEGVLRTRESDLLEAQARETNAAAAETTAIAASMASTGGEGKWGSGKKKAIRRKGEGAVIGSGGEGNSRNTTSTAVSEVPLESKLLRVSPLVAVLLLDSKFSALGVDGTPNPAVDALAQTFVPDAFWAYLEEEVLGRDSTMKALITVTALPVVDTTRENCAAHAARGSSFDAVLGRWSSRPKEQERLLSSLFDWKAKDPARELLFVAGGMRCSSHTLLRDDSWPGLVANGEKV